MMRFKETQTRYFPEPVPSLPESNLQVQIQFEVQHLINRIQSQRNFFVVGHPDLVEKDGDTDFKFQILDFSPPISSLGLFEI